MHLRVFERITRQDDYMCVLHVVLFKIVPKKTDRLQHNNYILALEKNGFLKTSRSEMPVWWELNFVGGYLRK